MDSLQDHAGVSAINDDTQGRPVEHGVHIMLNRHGEFVSLLLDIDGALTLSRMITEAAGLVGVGRDSVRINTNLEQSPLFPEDSGRS